MPKVFSEENAINVIGGIELSNSAYIVEQLNRFLGGCRNAFTIVSNRVRKPSLCMNSFFMNYFMSRACGGNLQSAEEGSVEEK